MVVPGNISPYKEGLAIGVLADWQIEKQVKIEPFDRGLANEGRLSSGLTSYGYDARVGYRFQVFSPINATVIDPKAFDPKSLVTVDLTPGMVVPRWESETECGYQCVKCGHGFDHPKDKLYEGDCPECRKKDHLLIPPNSFALAETVEYFEIPRDVLAFVVGKSTYARCGVIVPVTPLEPEWRGKVTVEISNTTPLPAKVYCGEGIMQIIFLRSDGTTRSMFANVYDWVKAHEDLNAGPYPAPYAMERLKLTLQQKTILGTCHRSYADRSGKYQDQTGLTHPSVREDDSNE